MARSMIRSLLVTVPLGALPPVGHWSLCSAPDVQAAIARTIAPMNFLTRPFARSRLTGTNVIYRQLAVSRTAQEITIQYEDRPEMRMPADGTPVAWTRNDGEKMAMRARMDGEDLEQTFKAADGQRTNRFHVDPATGHLVMGVTVSSGRLPGPLTYQAEYQPAPGY